jgi:hypothetical protein
MFRKRQFVRGESDITRVVDESNPDSLIVELHKFDRYPAICNLILRRLIQLKVLALAAERNRSMFF